DSEKKVERVNCKFEGILNWNITQSIVIAYSISGSILIIAVSAIAPKTIDTKNIVIRLIGVVSKGADRFDGVSGRNCNNSDVNMTKSESHKVNSKRLEPVRQLTGLNTVKIQLFVKE
ncbi:23912_t:CDS:2, partial [Entrophospora sp. SA101]